MCVTEGDLLPNLLRAWRQVAANDGAPGVDADLQAFFDTVDHEKLLAALNVEIADGSMAKNQRLGEMIRAVNRYLRGWHWYFKGVWSKNPAPFAAFDRFARVRLRLAITGRLGSGWWRQRMPNRWLHRLGLIPLTEWRRRYQTGQLEAPSR